MSGAATEDARIEGRFEGQLGDFRLDAAFAIAESGITALVGPSGSGKTSLLRCIAGLARLPGRLRVGGEVWQDERVFLRPHQRAIGYVFQEPSMLAHLPVRGNLLFGYRRSKDGSRIAFDEVVGLLGLADLLGRSTHRLSGGERQRVAIGRALLSQPRLLLMDEPVSSLDARSKAEILPYLERLHETLSIPVIYVSHDPAEVARLADTVLLMRDGRITGSAMGVGRSRGGKADNVGRVLDGLDQAAISRLAAAAVLAGLQPFEAG